MPQSIDRYVKKRAADMKMPQIAVYEEAVEFLQTRERIARYIADSIARNMIFPTWEEFADDCRRKGKIPLEAGRIVSPDSFVLSEVYIFLHNWHERDFRRSYIDEFSEREYWRHPDSLTLDAFAEMEAVDTLVREHEEAEKRKAEATA